MNFTIYISKNIRTNFVTVSKKKHSVSWNWTLQCWPRCTVRTFTSLHAAGICTPNVHECIYGYHKIKPLYSVQYLAINHLLIEGLTHLIQIIRVSNEINLWKRSVYYMYVHVLPALTFRNSMFAHIDYLCVMYGFQNKQLLFPYSPLTDWVLYPRWRVFSARYEVGL